MRCRTEVDAIARRSLSHHAFVLKPKTLVEPAGAGIVFEHIEKQSMRVQVPKDYAQNFVQHSPSQTMSWLSDHNALQFERTAAIR